jgi:hypothetical protein
LNQITKISHSSGFSVDFRFPLPAPGPGRTTPGHAQEEPNLADYLSFTSSNGGADTVIQVSSHGGGAAGVDQTIVLEGVDLATLGADDSAIINNLLASNRLLVDA